MPSKSLAAEVDTLVIFDKTGTLTVGRPEVIAIRAAVGTEAELLAAAAAVERDSEHPLARAVVAAAKARGVAARGATEVAAVPGGGVRGQVAGALVAVGTPALVAAAGADADAAAALASELAAGGATPMLVVRAGVLLGGLAVRDRVRDDAAATVAALRRRGLAVALVSGDRAEAVAEVARAVGIDDVVAGVDPPGKLAQVRARAAARSWSATATTTRRRWPPPRSGSRSAPAPTWRPRRPT